jgi:hypothetical protein
MRAKTYCGAERASGAIREVNKNDTQARALQRSNNGFIAQAAG